MTNPDSTIMDEKHTKRARVTDFALLDEAMRRAAWEATHGPRHLRSGRYWPTVDAPRAKGLTEKAEEFRKPLPKTVVDMD